MKKYLLLLAALIAFNSSAKSKQIYENLPNANSYQEVIENDDFFNYENSKFSFDNFNGEVHDYSYKVLFAKGKAVIGQGEISINEVSKKVEFGALYLPKPVETWMIALKYDDKSIREVIYTKNSTEYFSYEFKDSCNISYITYNQSKKGIIKKEVLRTHFYDQDKTYDYFKVLKWASNFLENNKNKCNQEVYLISTGNVKNVDVVFNNKKQNDCFANLEGIISGLTGKILSGIYLQKIEDNVPIEGNLRLNLLPNVEVNYNGKKTIGKRQERNCLPLWQTSYQKD